MDYVFLVYLPESLIESLSATERERLDEAHDAYRAELTKTGQLRAWSALQPVTTATTLRWRGGKTRVSDGPFAESNEVLGGFFAVECRNLDEAVALAGRLPWLSAGGTVEVRPAKPD